MGVSLDLPTDTPKNSVYYWESLGNDGSKKPRQAMLCGAYW